MKLGIIAGLIGLLTAGTLPAGEPGKGRPEGRPEGRGERRGGPEAERGDRRGGSPREKRDFFAHMLRTLDTDRSGSISFREFSQNERLERLTDDQRRQLFDRLDKNKDGEIRREEISRPDPGRRPWGERRGDHSDTNKDGKMSLEEFRKSPRMAGVPAKRQEELFRKMDRNGDGFLDRKDFQGRRPERPGGGERPPRGPIGGPLAFEQLDTNQDGSLSFDEFRKAPRIKDMDEDRQEDLFEDLDRDDDRSLKKSEMIAPRGPGMGPGPDSGPGKPRGPGKGPKQPRRGDGQPRPERPKA